MPAEPTTRRRSAAAAARPAEPRSWLSNTVLALGISVAGLALAGTGALSTSAAPRTPVTGSPIVHTVPSPTPTPTVDPTVLSAYPGADEVEPSRLREAIVAERAAQRAEELAKNADEVSRSARTAIGEARQQQLDADELATQAKGAELAQEALDRAVAARLAAAAARLAATAAAQAAAESGQPALTSPTTIPTTPTVVDSGAGVSPVPGAVVGAGFGDVGLWARYHTGLDFRAAYGTPIRAVKSGVVLYAGNSGNWSGNHVAIRHADGMTTMSSHMSSMAVSAGQTVTAGQVIGYVGETGRAFGAHLHFELYPVGVKYGDIYKAINPVPWLRAAGVITR